MNVHEVALIALQSILTRAKDESTPIDSESIAKEAFEVASAFVLESYNYGLLHKKDNFFQKTGVETIG